MELYALPYRLTVCKLRTAREADLSRPFYFLSCAMGEGSLVCRAEDVPDSAIAREEDWKGFRVAGTMDFSLTGILAGLTKTFADARIPVFAVSTFDTDYLLVKEDFFVPAREALEKAGHIVRCEEQS